MPERSDAADGSPRPQALGGADQQSGDSTPAPAGSLSAGIPAAQPNASAGPRLASPPATLAELLALVRASGLVDEAKLKVPLEAQGLPDDPGLALDALVQAGLLTRFHAWNLRQGKYRGFLLGPYKVLRPLGKGGMGLVYLAEHTSLPRRVAVKLLRTDLAGKSGIVERFQREGRTASALDHPNIVRIYDLCHGDEGHFLVMEYVEGRSLEDLVREKGPLSVRQAVDYCLQVASALQHAHERGVVHRDIKPANLLLVAGGTVKVLDMGLARFYADSSDNLTERLGGGVLGSPDYIAPEQALGQLDIRCDIYSLGATLYMLLVGHPPFAFGSVADKLRAHQAHAVVPPHTRNPAIPAGLSAVVVRMLAKGPAARFQAPAEVIAALQPWSSGAEQPVPATRRRWGRAAVVAVTATATVLAAGLLAWGVLVLVR